MSAMRSDLREALRDVAEAAGELAPALKAYHVMLKEVGFSDGEAFQLVRDFHGNLLAGTRERVARQEMKNDQTDDWRS